MIKREAIKKLNEMIVDSQYAQQLGIRVFNGQSTPDERHELKILAHDLITSIQIWEKEIPNEDFISVPESI